MGLALVAGCAIALLLVRESAGASKQRAPLTIGGLFSLTGSGEPYGPQQLRAAQLAVAQINAEGGVDGAPLRLVASDDRSDPAYATAAMRTMIEKNRALAVLGPTLSLVAVHADPLADSLRTPVVSVSNTADGIVGRCTYPCRWVWRDSLGASASVPANIRQFVLVHHPSSAVIVHTADVLGETESAYAVRTFSSGFVRVLGNVAMPQSVPLRAAVTNALALRPQVLFIATSFPRQAIEVIRGARAAGYRGAILGGDNLNSASVAKLAGWSGAGVQSGAAWYGGNAFPTNAQFVTAYRQVYSSEPDQFAAQAFTGVDILASALQEGHLAGSTAPLGRQRAAVQEELGNTALMTPLGPFRFTASHDVDQIVWLQAIDGHGGHALVGFCDPGC